MARDVYLGAFDLGALWAVEQAIHRSGDSIEKDTDLFGLLCTTLMQAGADRFSIPGGNISAFTDSEYLRSRISNKYHVAADVSWLRLHRGIVNPCG